MTIGDRIKAALEVLGFPVSPNVYTGDGRLYITYSYQSFPALHAAGNPGAMRYLITVNLYVPLDFNPEELQNSICRRLHSAGFSYPSITNISDSDGQGYAFECEGFDGRV